MLEIKNTTIIPEHVLSFILALLGCVNHNTVAVYHSSKVMDELLFPHKKKKKINKTKL